MPPNENSSGDIHPIPKEPWITKYPTNRDVTLKSARKWLANKVIDDDLNGPYWRIHNKLYDLRSFAALHPGGREWIDLTRGTDITEAFESAHIFPKAETLLKKYYVKDINTERISPYTFHEDGFYRTLKKRIRPVLSTVGCGPTWRMLIMQDMTVAAFLALMVTAAYMDSILVMLLAGIVLDFTAAMAHNFFHQKDNFRRFYFDLTLLSSSDWRVSHALSHHLYTNTLLDYEISVLEPFLQFLPDANKTWLAKYGSFGYHLIIYALAFHFDLIRRIINICIGEATPEYKNILSILELCFIALFAPSLYRAFQLWTILHLSCSFCFAYIGLIAAHHHPDVYHAGDRFRDNPDWGLCQLDAVRDRIEITGSLFLVAISFGDHTLHHLFPTVDHSKLCHLYPVFSDVCKEFGVPFEFIQQKDLIWGKYAQLTNSKPNLQSPGYHRKSV